MSRPPYDIFVSYRREGADATARLLYEHLLRKGYRVAFDLETLRAGNFDDQILDAIRGCRDVIVVLSPKALDRCSDPADWVRREVACALESGKNIVPVLLRGFSFPPPESLPEDIRDLPRKQGVEASMKRLDATIADIEALLSAKPVRRIARRTAGMFSSVLAALFVAVLVWAWPGIREIFRPHSPAAPPASSAGVDPPPPPAEDTPEEPPPDPAPAPGPAVGETRILRICDGYDAELVWCPPGTFLMGSPGTEVGRNPRESLHRVRLTSGFWMAKHPVTQREWRLVMGSNPSWFKQGGPLSEEFRTAHAGDPAFDSPDHPVEHVSWFDCAGFLDKASRDAGVPLRLPTEAEWEYAARAGSTFPFPWGDALNGDLANVDGRHPCASLIEGPYLERTSPVGSYPPNAWGLFDMHGNVYEWTSDFYADYPEGDATDPSGPPYGAAKVVRGGNWCNSAAAARSAARHSFVPSAHNSRTGFRFCLSPENIPPNPTPAP